MARIIHPVTGESIGHNDSIQFARIGRGAVTLEIDFAKLKPLFNDGLGAKLGDILQLAKLVGNSQVRGAAVQVVKPLALATADGTAAAYGTVLLTPTLYANGAGGSAVTSASVAAAANFAGKTFFGDAANAVLADVNALGEPVDNELCVVMTTVPADKHIVDGIIVVTVYSDYAFTAEELGMFAPQHGDSMSTGSSVADGGEI